VNVNSCSGNNTSFSVTVTGTTPAYQWQVNTGSGFVNVTNVAPYAGATTSTLTITGLTAGMNGYQYRCVLSNTCTPAFNSNTASLTVGTNASISGQPTDVTVCTGVNTSLTVVATAALSYQWQVNSGSGFVNVTNVAPYAGATAATLTITAPAASLSGNQYRCVIGSCSGALNSNAATLTISVPVSISAQPASVTICDGGNVSFAPGITGTASAYQWQISTDGGSTYSNISGATSSTYSITNVPGHERIPVSSRDHGCLWPCYIQRSHCNGEPLSCFQYSQHEPCRSLRIRSALHPAGECGRRCVDGYRRSKRQL